MPVTLVKDGFVIRITLAMLIALLLSGISTIAQTTGLPYGNTAATIPGIVEAENYDYGGQGSGYMDADVANNGGKYRTDGVDIESAGDGGYDVGWTAAGEMMKYTVNVTTAGYYTLSAKVSSNTGGGAFHVSIGTTNISGSMAVANTGGWQFWQTMSTTTTYLAAGTQTLYIYTDAAGFNIDNISFAGPVTSGLSANLTAPLNNVTYTSASSIPLTATATSSGTISKVEFYANGVKLGQATSSPYTFNWTNVPYGMYSITAKATDNINATTTSQPVTITVTATSNCPQLTWSDEFSGNSLDATKWNYQTGNGCPGICGWGNNELEYFTNTTNNVSVANGALAIKAQYQPNYNGSGNDYTSGKLVTSGKFSQKYGHFEARVKVPSSAGAWPAFWMLADNTNWPATGEIDILECRNANPVTWFGTLHFGDASGNHLSQGYTYNYATPLSNDYHIYSAYWTPDSISWYIDNILKGTVTKTALIAGGGVWPYDSQNFYIILNLSIGGQFSGQTPDPTQFPLTMLVDYVRVYSSNTCTSCTYNTWTGAVSNAWENTLNWSCGRLPDSTTNVIINAVGTNMITVSSNVKISSLQINPAVHITINPGYNFKIHTDTSTVSNEIPGFVHPGVLNTKANLDLIASQANSGDATRTAAYQKVLDYINSHALPTSFPSIVYVGSNGHTSPSKDQIRKDAELVYALALRFAKTADITYANQAIAILNGWAYNFQSYSTIDSTDNPNQPDLEASWTTPSFVAAAEIIRYYKPNGVSANWSAADINQFNNYLNNVKNNYINNVPAYNNNWNVSAGYAKMAIGVFLNSTTVFTGGESMITAVLPQVIQSDGTMPELCVRQDCVHYQYSLTGLTYAAEIANMQGDASFYTALSNRISAGYDFMRSAYNQGTGCNYCTTSSPVFPGVEVAYHHYGTANMLYLRNLQPPLEVPNDNTFLGFTTYTHFNVGVTP
jgi:beta-glucanase (GH16 family)